MNNQQRREKLIAIALVYACNRLAELTGRDATAIHQNLIKTAMSELNIRSPEDLDRLFDTLIIRRSA